MKFGAVASIALMAVDGSRPVAAADPEVPSNKAIVMRTVNELWSRGDLRAADSLYAPEFVCHNLVGPDWRGVEGIKDAIKAHRDAFPDWQEHVEDIVAEGDRVAVRFTASGTQRRPFAGIPATGRMVTVREVSFYRLRDGKIVEQWGMPDINGMLTQLKRRE